MYNLAPPCSGASTDAGANARKNDGTGWVKVNFAGQASVTVSTLPSDTTNNSTYHYSYSSDGSYYELNAVLESTKYSPKMAQDGGDNPNVYEVGSKLTLIH